VTIILNIDGSSHTGNYQVSCLACGDTWRGQGESIGVVNWDPALPVAECVVHIKIAHVGSEVDIRFSDRFRMWLIHYWERASLRAAAAGDEARRSLVIRAARLGRER
jgi:hypothetical protein